MPPKMLNLRNSACITNLQKIEANFWQATENDQLAILKTLSDFLNAKIGLSFERKFAADLLVRAIVAKLEISKMEFGDLRPYLDSLKSCNCASPLSKSMLFTALRLNFPTETFDQRTFSQIEETQISKPIKRKRAKKLLSGLPVSKSTLSDPFADESGSKEPQNEINLYNFINTVHSILETDYYKASSTPNLAFALLDLDGNFLFACSNARRIFSLTSKNLIHLNFRDILTPFSMVDIMSKFPEGLYNFAGYPGSKKRFSYVVFSKRCEKIFRFNAKAISEEKRRKMINYMSREEISNLCLESLHSSIEIVKLKITRMDFENWQSADGDIKEVYIGRATKRYRSIFKPFVKGKLKRTKISTDGRRPERAEGVDTHVVPAVLMRTWLATKMLDYPYEMLNDHYKIKDFKNTMARDLEMEVGVPFEQQTMTKDIK